MKASYEELELKKEKLEQEMRALSREASKYDGDN